MGNYRLAKLGLAHLEDKPDILREALHVRALIEEQISEEQYKKSEKIQASIGTKLPTWEEHMVERDKARAEHPEYVKIVAERRKKTLEEFTRRKIEREARQRGL